MTPTSASTSAPAWRPLPTQPPRYATRHADAAVTAFLRGLQLQAASRSR